MYLRTEGIILAHRNFGEADRILTIYTKDYGKISAIAKGVRRPRSKKGGHVELGNWCKAFLVKGKNLDLLTEVETKKAFGIDNFTSEKANKIYHLLELVDSLTQHEQKNQKVFFLLLEFLDEILKENNFDLISSVFKVKLLSELGFFSAKNLKDSKTKQVLEFLENEEFEKIKEKVNSSNDSLGPQSRDDRGTRTARLTSSQRRQSYLKLLTFLDSMIENLIERTLKTNRFVNETV